MNRRDFILKVGGAARGSPERKDSRLHRLFGIGNVTPGEIVTFAERELASQQFDFAVRFLHQLSGG